MVKNKTRITLDFDAELQKTCEALEQIICSSYWSSGINIVTDEDHNLLFKFVKLGVIVIDECEYELQEPFVDDEHTRQFISMLGKRSFHPVLREMAALFYDEPFKMAEYYRNTLFFPNIKAYARADGVKPEDIAYMLKSEEMVLHELVYA